MSYPRVPWGNLVYERSEQVDSPVFPPLSVGRLGVTPQLENIAKAKDKSIRKIVRQGDLVINSRSDRRGASGLSQLDGTVSVVYSVMTPRPNTLDPSFAHHLLRSGWFQEEFYRHGTGIVADLWSTRFEKMRQIRVPLPPLDTQRAIADYLDRETSEIDAMLDKLDGLGRLLEERREVAISQVVSDTEMRYARVAVQTLGLINSGDAISSEDIKEEGTFPVYGGNGLRGYSEKYNQSTSKILIGRQGALCGNVHLATGTYWASEHALVVSPNVEFNPKWLLYVLRNEKLGRLSTAAAQPGITASAVGRQKIPLPPMDEQERIVAHLDEITTRIDAMLAKTNELKDLLTERRSALITAAVTGQIEVQ